MGLTRPRAYQIFDIDYKQSVRVVTVSNVTLGGGAPSQVDGVSLSLNDRVLVTGQSTASQNGLYYVTTVGTGSNGTWQRSVDGNETGEIDAGMIVMVTEGTTYADTQWKLTTNDPIVIGSTALTFVQNYSANSISAGTSNVVVNSNANVTISAAGTANVLTVTSTGANVAGYANITGNINTAGTLNINSTSGNYNVLNISGTALAPYGTPQTWKFFTNNTALGGSASFILFPDSSTQTTAYPGTASTLSLTGNITGGNLIANTAVIATGNITGGNLITAGLISATGNITGGNIIANGRPLTSLTASNIDTGTLAQARLANASIVIGNTTATLGATVTTITGLTSVTSTTFVGALTGAATTAGTVTTAAQPNITSVGTLSSLTVSGNVTGGNLVTGGAVSATGAVSGSLLYSLQSLANEGGEISLALPSSGSTLTSNVIIDVYQNKLRFFEGGGTARGAYIDLTSCSAGAATNLLASGGGGTPGGSNTYVQFNDGGTFGGNGQFVYDKVTNTLTAGIIAANNNGAGTNFKVGDDAWIGDINAADTMRVMGQQNAANAYIVFGNADGVALGRAGSGALTYGGAFTATGNITGGNLSGTSIVGTLTTAAQTNITSVGTLGSLAVTANITGGNANISGRILVGSGNAAAPGITFSADTSQDTGFYWISDGNIGISTNGTLRVTIDGAGNVTATGNISGGNIIANGRPLTSLNATNIDTGTLGQARLANSSIIIGNTTSTLGATVTTITGLTSVTSTTFVGALTGAATSATTAGTVTTAAQPNITSVGTLSSLSVTANVTGGNLITAGLLSVNSGNVTGTVIVNAGANGVGNIGSATGYFNTAHVKATSAQYADLAEMYVADGYYPPGHVVVFGGEKEITLSTKSHDTAVAGIISTNPSYLMNATQEGDFVLAVALTGRVPCLVQGPVSKGDVLVTGTNPGTAQRIGINWQPGCTVGKAMEDINDSVVKVIEVAVGRL